MLAAYSKPEDSSSYEQNGLICLWSLALRKKPEFVFTYQTEITSALFHKFNPKYIVGASYTGQILIWDTRGKNIPVQKTPAGAKYHSQPIYCLDITGTQNSNNIISVSTDGVLCTWSLANMSKPVKKIELKNKKRKTDNLNENKLNSQFMDELGAVCMASQENDTNNILIGTDDSEIYQVYTHQTSEHSDNIVEAYSKHTGPISSLHMHPGDLYKNINVNKSF